VSLSLRPRCLRYLLGASASATPFRLRAWWPHAAVFSLWHDAVGVINLLAEDVP
jgi:hypothetical protein